MNRFDLQKLRDLPIEGVAQRLGLRVSRDNAFKQHLERRQAKISRKCSAIARYRPLSHDRYAGMSYLYSVKTKRRYVKTRALFEPNALHDFTKPDV